MTIKGIVSQKACPEDSGVDLVLLLGTLDATEEDWVKLPDPYNRFLREARRAVADAAGVFDGD
jgi:hypothetical protein